MSTIAPVVGRLRRGGRHRLVVVVGLAVFVLGVYVIVVLGGGGLIGRTDSPSLPLSVLATAVVALMFAPVQAGLERAAASLGLAGTAAPYDVLRHFSQTVQDGYATEELPARTSKLLAQGTGAQWAQVWLAVSGRLSLTATWPPDADADQTRPNPTPQQADAAIPGRRALAVRHDGQLLGVLRLQERPGLPLSTVEERLFSGLAAQAGLVLRQVRLRAELAVRHDELLVRAEELKASRERLIATQDAERQRLERDLHDGAQQHLVALAVNLRLAQTLTARAPQRAARVLVEQADAARAAIETLTSLSRGIYPSLLSNDGLLPALRSAVATSAIPVSIDADGIGRLPGRSRRPCTSAVQRRSRTPLSTPARAP